MLVHNWKYRARAYRDARVTGNWGKETEAKLINGWAVTDAYWTDEDSGVPGIYLSFSFNERHAVTVEFSEQDLLEMLAEVQEVKRRHGFTQSPKRETV